MICLQQPSRVKGDIGHYTDGNSAPLVHCVRLLSASFLLTGEKGGKFLWTHNGSDLDAHARLQRNLETLKHTQFL